MAQPILMPNVGISVESCILTEWNKRKGDKVTKGELLFSFETDKSTLEETASCDGTILEQFFEEGDDIPVMTVIGVIGQPGENIDEFIPKKPNEEQAAKNPAQNETQKPVKADTEPINTQAVSDGFVGVSPRAKALAAKAGVDARFATPTGAEGRIVESDVHRLIDKGPSATFAAAQAFDGAEGTGIGGKYSVSDIGSGAPTTEPVTAPLDYTDEKMSRVRSTIAASMMLSLSTIPQLTHTLTFDATEILAFRNKVKSGAESLGLANITLNDIVLFAASRLLSKPEHRALNAHALENNTVRYFNSVNLGVAVDTEKGLLVPTLFNADKKSLNEISLQAKELASICQKGLATPDMLNGGTFTVSNVGAFGIESFTPVINPPQTGILGVNGITTRVREVDGELKAYKAMGLSLTYNHAVVDGAPASRFLADLKNALENFSILLCK